MKPLVWGQKCFKHVAMDTTTQKKKKKVKGTQREKPWREEFSWEPAHPADP